MDCPNCGLINPEGAVRCDCGYCFADGRVKPPASEPDPVRQVLAYAENDWFVGPPLLPLTAIAEFFKNPSKPDPDEVPIDFLPDRRFKCRGAGGVKDGPTSS